jgi:predicted SAM-dependent methyltransferase
MTSGSDRTPVVGSMPEACNICLSAEFGPGPGGRMAASGKLPQCRTCQSLERHRALRDLYTGLVQAQKQLLSSWDLLQFSDDRAVDPEYFANCEVSQFGSTNHLDLQNIDRATSSYDVVVCNHVLEHVPDDCRAIRELWRICRSHGFVQIAVPDPPRRAITDDWGYPRSSDHEHYRLYGRDIFEKILSAVWDAYVVEVDAIDPVTQHVEASYFVTKSDLVVEALAAKACLRRFRTSR